LVTRTTAVFSQQISHCHGCSNRHYGVLFVAETAQLADSIGIRWMDGLFVWQPAGL